MDGGAWWTTLHGVAKSQTGLSEFTFTFHFHALEREMETHFSVLAWRIPGMGEAGRLPSMGSHRVRHDWSDLAVAVNVKYLFLPHIIMFKDFFFFLDITSAFREKLVGYACLFLILAYILLFQGRLSIVITTYKWNCLQTYFPPALLKYKWQIKMVLFLKYTTDMMFGYMYTLCTDYHKLINRSNSSYHYCVLEEGCENICDLLF